MEILGVINVPTPLLWAVILFTSIYWYLTKNFNYWKSKGIPYAKPYPIVGSVGSFLYKPFQTVETQWYKKYGRVYGGFDGRDPYLSIGDPEIIKNITVKDFMTFPMRRDVRCGNTTLDNMVSTLLGDDWKRVRTIITPIFTSGKLKKLYSIMVDSCTTLRAHLITCARTGTPVDVLTLFRAFSMDAILSTAFGTKVDSLSDPNNRLVSMSATIFRSKWRMFAYFLCPGLMKMLGVNVFSTEAITYLQDFTVQLINERKNSGKKKNDFLQLLLDAAEETEVHDTLDKECATMAHEERNAEIFKKSSSTKNLSHAEIVSQAVLFLAAGYDTLVTTLSGAAYNLALNPECQEKLIQEVDAAFENNKEVDYDTIQSLKYLDSVVNETLRIDSTVIRLERQCQQDYRLQDLDITIPKGMIVCLPIYGMHRDPEFYPEPEKFAPERFLPENKSNIVPYSYFPFGLGPRNCIGMRFAIMEMKTSLAHIVRHFRFKRCPETKVPLDYFAGNILIAPKSITLGIELRNDVPAS